MSGLALGLFVGVCVFIFFIGPVAMSLLAFVMGRDSMDEFVAMVAVILCFPATVACGALVGLFASRSRRAMRMLLGTAAWIALLLLVRNFAPLEPLVLISPWSELVFVIGAIGGALLADRMSRR